MEEDHVVHKVEIDEYLTAEIKIPKVMTAIDLKGLMIKASKLFNLSSVETIVPKKNYTERYSWTSEQIEEFKRLYEQHKGELGFLRVIAEEMDIPYDKIVSKKNQLYTKGEI